MTIELVPEILEHVLLLTIFIFETLRLSYVKVLVLLVLTTSFSCFFLASFAVTELPPEHALPIYFI